MIKTFARWIESLYFPCDAGTAFPRARLHLYAAHSAAEVKAGRSRLLGRLAGRALTEASSVPKYSRLGRGNVALAVFGLFLIPFSVIAQVALTYTDYSQTISTSATNCVAPDSSIKTLAIQNASTTANVGYCYRNPSTPSTPCTPVIGSAGTWTIPLGPSLFYWVPGEAPKNGLDCIASASSTVINVTIGR